MKIIEHDDGTYSRYWQCACGLKLETDSHSGGHDVECSCGRWFNCFGQQLRPADPWEDYYS